MIHNERGVVLFIALVFLLVLTIAGVSSVQTTSLEERMARNTHDSVLAFQAAESALREAEAFVRNNVSSTAPFTPAGNNGLWSAAAYTDQDRWLVANVWNDGSSLSRQTNSSLALVAAQPRYIVEWVATVERETNANLIDSSYNAVSDRVEIFRITARGVGGTTNASVLLQSTFGKFF
ncbi:MAG: PilX N-terminal domain-containing pilus assembly protein [Proteobacteria bacterium]|nr:PilX N-terminal domain-containing pilus assembly protein [Pseudomonadota bacterium]